MKVNNKSTVSSSYRGTKTTAAGAYNQAQRTSESRTLDDSVEVSESASLFQMAVDAVSGVPDIRTQAIEGIQREFRDGTYHRDETEVAERVLQDHLTTP